jgi:hypothetical protein
MFHHQESDHHHHHEMSDDMETDDENDDIVDIILNSYLQQPTSQTTTVDGIINQIVCQHSIDGKVQQPIIDNKNGYDGISNLNPRNNNNLQRYDDSKSVNDDDKSLDNLHPQQDNDKHRRHNHNNNNNNNRRSSRKGFYVRSDNSNSDPRNNNNLHPYDDKAVNNDNNLHQENDNYMISCNNHSNNNNNNNNNRRSSRNGFYVRQDASNTDIGPSNHHLDIENGHATRDGVVNVVNSDDDADSALGSSMMMLNHGASKRSLHSSITTTTLPGAVSVRPGRPMHPRVNADDQSTLTPTSVRASTSSHGGGGGGRRGRWSSHSFMISSELFWAYQPNSSSSNDPNITNNNNSPTQQRHRLKSKRIPVVATLIEENVEDDSGGITSTSTNNTCSATTPTTTNLSSLEQNNASIARNYSIWRTYPIMEATKVELMVLRDSIFVRQQRFSRYWSTSYQHYRRREDPNHNNNNTNRKYCIIILNIVALMIVVIIVMMVVTIRPSHRTNNHYPISSSNNNNYNINTSFHNDNQTQPSSQTMNNTSSNYENDAKNIVYAYRYPYTLQYAIIIVVSHPNASEVICSTKGNNNVNQTISPYPMNNTTYSNMTWNNTSDQKDQGLSSQIIYTIQCGKQLIHHSKRNDKDENMNSSNSSGSSSSSRPAVAIEFESSTQKGHCIRTHVNQLQCFATIVTSKYHARTEFGTIVTCGYNMTETATDYINSTTHHSQSTITDHHPYTERHPNPLVMASVHIQSLILPIKPCHHPFNMSHPMNTTITEQNRIEGIILSNTVQVSLNRLCDDQLKSVIQPSDPSCFLSNVNMVNTTSTGNSHLLNDSHANKTNNNTNNTDTGYYCSSDGNLVVENYNENSNSSNYELVYDGLDDGESSAMIIVPALSVYDINTLRQDDNNRSSTTTTSTTTTCPLTSGYVAPDVITYFTAIHAIMDRMNLNH